MNMQRDSCRVCGLAASNCTGKEEMTSDKSQPEDWRALAITLQLKVSESHL